MHRKVDIARACVLRCTRYSAALRGSRVPDSPAVTVSTVEGGQVELPCDITSGPGQDSVYLVLWYRKVC